MQKNKNKCIKNITYKNGCWKSPLLKGTQQCGVGIREWGFRCEKRPWTHREAGRTGQVSFTAVGRCEHFAFPAPDCALTTVHGDAWPIIGVKVWENKDRRLLPVSQTSTDTSEKVSQRMSEVWIGGEQMDFQSKVLCVLWSSRVLPALPPSSCVGALLGPGGKGGTLCWCTGALWRTCDQHKRLS